MPFWKRTPDRYSELLEQGHQLMHQDRPADALPLFEQCVVLRPKAGQAWSSLGQALLDVQRLPEAIVALEHARRFTPNDLAAWYNAGLAHRRLGEFDRALALIEQALQLNPDAWLAWHEKGIILCKNERPEQIERIAEQHLVAFDAFSQAALLRPDHLAAWLWRGRLAWRLTHSVQARARVGVVVEPDPQFYFDAALASFDHVLALAPDDPATLFDKGRTLKDFGAYAEAREVYRRLTRVAGHPNDWYQLALVNNDLGDKAELFASLGQALTLDPALRADAVNDFEAYRDDTEFQQLLEG